MDIERFDDGYTVFFEGDEIYFDTYEEAEAFVEENKPKPIEIAVTRQFWTRQSEMIEGLEEKGFEVLEANDEYLIVQEEGDEEEIQLFLGHAGNTIWVERIR